MRVADFAVMDAGRDTHIPSITAEALLAGGPVLVLAPHPDDESLACGALLAAAFSAPGGPRHTHVVCLTDGAASHPGSQIVSPGDLARIRRREIETAVIRLGDAAADVTWIGAPDGALAATPDIVGRVTKVARDCEAGLVLAPSALDPHCDHVAGAASDAPWRQGSPGCALASTRSGRAGMAVAKRRYQRGQGRSGWRQVCTRPKRPRQSKPTQASVAA